MNRTAPKMPDADVMAKWRERNPLRKWRKEHGLTLYNLAIELDRSYQTLNMWEAGVTMPADDNMANIAREMNVPTATLAAEWERWKAAAPKGK